MRSGSSPHTASYQPSFLVFCFLLYLHSLCKAGLVLLNTLTVLLLLLVSNQGQCVDVLELLLLPLHHLGACSHQYVLWNDQRNKETMQIFTSKLLAKKRPRDYLENNGNTPSQPQAFRNTAGLSVSRSLLKSTAKFLFSQMLDRHCVRDV